MGHHPDKICKIESSPHEALRPEVPRLFLGETVRCITQFVQGRPSELVFNFDEIGISDWENRTAKNVIVPKSMCEQMIHHKANRNLKHISITAGISPAGESMRLTFAIFKILRPRTIEKCGIRFGTDFFLKSRAKPSMNTEDFAE
jgi:hypothetical protein